MSAHTPHELHEEFPHDADTLRRLKATDAHFAKMSERYHALNRSIHRIEVEAEAASDAYLTQLRKQRLQLLDEIAVMIEHAEARDAGPTPTPSASRLFGRSDAAAA